MQFTDFYIFSICYSINIQLFEQLSSKANFKAH